MSVEQLDFVTYEQVVQTGFENGVHVETPEHVSEESWDETVDILALTAFSNEVSGAYIGRVHHVSKQEISRRRRLGIEKFVERLNNLGVSTPTVDELIPLVHKKPLPISTRHDMSRVRGGVSLQIEQLMKEGMSFKDAFRAVRKRNANITQVRAVISSWNISK